MNLRVVHPEGCTLMVMVYAFGGISGGHFNPAVSLSLALSKSMGGPGVSFQDAGIYTVVQIGAGCRCKQDALCSAIRIPD